MHIERAYAEREGLPDSDLGRLRASLVDQVQRYEDAIRGYPRDKMYGVKVSAIREKRVKAIGFDVPQVPFPTNVKQVGRQWTKEGEDKPKKAE